MSEQILGTLYGVGAITDSEWSGAVAGGVVSTFLKVRFSNILRWMPRSYSVPIVSRYT